MLSLGFGVLAALPFLSRFAHAQSCAPMDSVKITFYGYPDGPSDITSFGCSGSTPVASTIENPAIAKGDGSYDNPFSLATMEGTTNLQECEMVYVPYLKKYFRYQDHCTGCDSNHIDLWVGTDTNGGSTQLDCERLLGTTTGNVIKNPGKDLPYNAQNLWDGSCHPDQVFPNADTSNMCSGSINSGGESSSPSSSSAVAPPAATPTPINLKVTHAVPPKKDANKPTTLLTVASAPVSTNEPTGTPLATSNGVCTVAGNAVCSVDGKQIGICNSDLTVIFMDVAPGTKCVNGGMIYANA